ncbi:flagellar protein FlbD [Halarsenatibacter silvermanii]|uniref:Flagellar protein FlbD n=2 Tax=Halarsenatibacter silvermanii TaxID=321763 RepID=A0A1G9MIR2_9FIRM|nr:flagellar protein FlbD [Halarsenatibacter silvermanii]
MGGEPIILNANLIENIRSTPDTVITLTTEKKIIVEEETGEIIERVIEYQRKIHNSHPRRLSEE